MTGGHIACISLGSNIDPVENLRAGLDRLQAKLDVVAISSVWETPPVGTGGPFFLNAAVLASTTLPPREMVHDLLRPIEAQLGRVRSADKYAPRTLDLDLVIYDSRVLDARLWEYAYLAIPVAELIPDFENPEAGTTLVQIARVLRKRMNIEEKPGVFSLA